MQDLIIKNGFIIDGTGKAGYAADIGIRNGIIENIGNLEHDCAKTFQDGIIS